ncbi:MAG: hypothetical protein ACRDD2_09695 [Sarcina sp.]
MINIGEKIRLYSSGDMVRNLGIIGLKIFIEQFKGFDENYKDIEVNLLKNYLEFDFINPEEFTKFITEKILFDIFLNQKRKDFVPKIFTEEEYKSLNFLNFVEEATKKLSLKEKELKEVLKSFEGIRFPYLRNSSKYGLNGKDNSFKKVQNNFQLLFQLTEQGNINVKKENFKNYQVNEGVCDICNINKTTNLDLNFSERTDSKLIFLFKGAEESGFRNNGKSNSSKICFECEFLNLITLLYINLKKPSNLIYVNNLKEMNYLNHNLKLFERNFTEKELIKYLAKFQSKDLLLYRIVIDTNKGIILTLNKTIDTNWIMKEIKINDLIDRFKIDRETERKRNKGRYFLNNKNLVGLDRWFLSNLIGTVDEDSKSTVNKLTNLNIYYEFLNIKGKGE